MAEMICDDLVEELQKLKYLSVLVDERKDASKKEQISIVLRYHYNNQVYYSFMGLKAAGGLNAQSVAKSILEIMAMYDLDYGSSKIRSCSAYSIFVDISKS